MDRTEKIIVRQLKEGREKAYEFVYNYHYPILCHIAEQYVHDSFLAETIVSDVIFHVWEIRDHSTSRHLYVAILPKVFVIAASIISIHRYNSVNWCLIKEISQIYL